MLARMTVSGIGRGAALMLSAALLFAAMAAGIKFISQTLPGEMVVFFRNLFGLVALAPWILRHGWLSLGTRRPWGHVARSGAGLAAMYCYFFALGHLSLAEAVLLNYSMPLFIPFIAWWWLGEHVAPRLWGAIGIGFLGIVLILKPGLSLFSPVSLVGLAAGMLGATAMVGIRRLTRTEPAFRIVFYFSLLATIVSALPLLWRWQTPRPDLWLPLLGIGALATIAQILMTRAYAEAPAAAVGPFIYATVVFAALAGWGFWGEGVDLISLVGAVFVCVAGAATIRASGKHAAPVADVPAVAVGARRGGGQ
jgi:drug/metabolite transporter (DMT)-like permease